ncbi:hypothetical protein HY970_02775 [Candidatus Kaiserbacteria bacterium]|nr:hypothetical protein [Candidatus Kaiserbacteria bacterium]
MFSTARIVTPLLVLAYAHVAGALEVKEGEEFVLQSAVTVKVKVAGRNYDRHFTVNDSCKLRQGSRLKVVTLTEIEVVVRHIGHGFERGDICYTGVYAIISRSEAQELYFAHARKTAVDFEKILQEDYMRKYPQGP